MNDDNKIGFIYGFCIDMMHAHIESGANVHKTTNVIKNVIRDILTSFGFKYSETDFDEAMKFNYELHEYGEGRINGS